MMPSTSPSPFDANKIVRLAQTAKLNSMALAKATTAQKNAALLQLARFLQTPDIQTQLLAANQKDLDQAKKQGLSEPLIERLHLTLAILDTLAQGCLQLANLPDPIGEITGLTQQPTGIRVGQMRVPLGVFAMIFESRPNVTIEAASLAIKSGNACILRGGSEAWHSNQALTHWVQEALRETGLPHEAVQTVPTTDRQAIDVLLGLPQFIDVLIPRGGRGLIERVAQHARMPVIKHLDGNCHVYVDDPCDIAMAIRIADNAKTQKYSPCNAMESLLVATGNASLFLPAIGAIYSQKGIQMRACSHALSVLRGANDINHSLLQAATEADWSCEYLAPIVSIKIVQNLDEAMTHINHYSSHHTDSIVTDSHSHAQRFLREVDSSSVMVNASTRFADGFEYGLGAEIGISTDKFHARGPVGVLGLTSQKWIVLGEGQIRQ